MWKYNGSDDELYHYGVIGMRWGIRRANRLMARSEKKRAEGDIKKARALAKNSKIIRKFHTEMAGGKKVVNAVTRQSRGQLAAQVALMGSYGALKYNQAKTAGVSRGKSILTGVLSRFADVATSGFLGVYEPMISADAKRRK